MNQMQREIIEALEREIAQNIKREIDALPDAPLGRSVGDTDALLARIRAVNDPLRARINLMRGDA